VIRPFQLGEINILDWNVLNRRIRSFAEREGAPRVSNHTACDGHHEASAVAFDENRMIWTWKFDLLFVDVVASSWNATSTATTWGDGVARKAAVLLKRSSCRLTAVDEVRRTRDK
jgi:hypothetical protein